MSIIGRDETLDFCESVHKFITSYHVGKIGKSHQDCRKIGSRKNIFINLILWHNFKAAANSRN